MKDEQEAVRVEISYFQKKSQQKSRTIYEQTITYTDLKIKRR